MAKIFLDANILIDLVEKRGEVKPENFRDHDSIVSALSIHILMYVLKKKVPFSRLLKIIEPFSIVDLSGEICIQSLLGPINDFEDNVQLHSAAKAECDFFFTQDKKLLNMKFFGKTEIVSPQVIY